jgi:hypothetical protein
MTVKDNHLDNNSSTCATTPTMVPWEEIAYVCIYVYIYILVISTINILIIKGTNI